MTFALLFHEKRLSTTFRRRHHSKKKKINGLSYFLSVDTSTGSDYPLSQP